MNYEELLSEAYKKIKPIESKTDRFEPPEVETIIQGNKTIIKNFIQIANYLRRKPEHLEKFLEKTLAAKGKIENNRLTLIKRIAESKLNERIKEYIKSFVICKECGKPDTELVKQDNFLFIHCLACGAKHSVPKI